MRNPTQQEVDAIVAQMDDALSLTIKPAELLELARMSGIEPNFGASEPGEIVELRLIAAAKKAGAWQDNAHKVARKQNSERLTIFEAEAAQMPIETARYINRRRTDRGGNPLPSAIILMALMAFVVSLAIWHDQIFAWLRSL